MRDHKTIQALRSGEAIDLEGIRLVKADGEISPGDLYIAERNTGPHLLTCRKVNQDGGWVEPVGRGYFYDIHECVKVNEAGE